MSNSILSTLKKHPDFIRSVKMTGIFKGNPVSYIHVYMKKTMPSNPYNLETFNSSEGKGYLINITKKSKTMATKKAGLKKPTVKGLKKVCSGVVKATGLKADGTLKKGYKYIAGGKIVKVSAKTPVKKKVVKKKPAAKKKTVKKAKK